MSFSRLGRFPLNKSNISIACLVLSVAIVFASCAKNPPETPPVIDPPDTIGTPPVDTTVSGAAAKPTGIIIKDLTGWQPNQLFHLAYDNVGRLTDFSSDNAYDKDSFHFFYTAASDHYPTAYFQKGFSDYTKGNMHKIVLNNGYPVLDTLINQDLVTGYPYVTYAYTKDSLWQYFSHTDGGVQYKKKVVYDENELYSVEVEYTRRNDGDGFNLYEIDNYQYNDTLNPFYQPYVAPFIFKRNDFAELNNLFFKKNCSTMFSADNYETFDGVIRTYYDYHYDTKGRLIQIVSWRLGFSSTRENYRSWEIMY